MNLSIPTLAILAAAVSPWSNAQSLTRGPYLQMLAPDAVTIRWQTDEPTDSLVRYGGTPDKLSNELKDPAQSTEHEVRLTGLPHGSQWYYSVGDSKGELAGGDETCRFRTAPVPGTEQEVRVWVLGDSGTGTGGKGSGNAEKVRDGYVNSPIYKDPDVWLMLGDNAYGNGTEEEVTRAVFNTYPEILRKAVLWSALGNHDEATAQGAPYFNAFTFPKAAESGGVASGSEHYYSFDHANIHFISLDSQQAKHRKVDSPMLTWLEADLAATRQKWIVGFWHHPPYTKGSHDSDKESAHIEMRARVLPILEAHGVDLVLGGHSHCYERSMLIDGHYGMSTTFDPAVMAKDPGKGPYLKESGGHNGAIYIVAGNSGKVSGGALNHPVMVVSKNLLGSLVLDVKGDRMEVSEIGIDGRSFDKFTIAKGAR